MAITIKRNQKIHNLQIIDNIYIYICVCVCVCVREREREREGERDYTNSNVKTPKMTKKIYIGSVWDPKTENFLLKVL